MRASSPGLSPSRAADFLRCPLLFRFRVIDKLPEPPSAAARRGTLVHAVLEQLFASPRPDRTLPAALDLVPGHWERMQATEPELADLFAPGGSAHPQTQAQWLAAAQRLVTTYFELEDPTRLEPHATEHWVSHQLPDGPQLRGIVDRVDVAPDGAVRIVDYKTGKAPGPRYEHEPLFQMRWYALIWWREQGVVPKLLQLLYLGDGQIRRAEPQPAHLEATEAKVRAIWDEIVTACETASFRPQRSPLCGWCSFQPLCPQFGGTTPVLAPEVAASALGLG